MSDATIVDAAAATVSPFPGVDPVPVYTGPSTRKLIGFAGLIAIVAGLIGAVAAWAVFPPANGKVGPSGPAGAVGAVGPQGPAGSAADVQTAISKLGVNTGQLGYCFNTTSQSGTGAYWITGAYLSPPTDNNGALSCSSGQFVSLTPDNPQGQPVSGYNPLTGTTTSSQSG